MTLSPVTRRRLAIFRQNRRGFWALWIFLLLFGLSLFAEFIANDRPLLIRFDGHWYVPVLYDYSEDMFGSDFLPTEADYTDPDVQHAIAQHGWALWPPLPFSYDTTVKDLSVPSPAPPSWRDPLGTDDQARDVLARVIYGFRLSVLFGFTLTGVASVVGVIAGAVQGYYGGLTDLLFQRFIEIWSGMPELYLLIILGSIITPGFWVLLIFLLLFRWMNLTGVVRAEFLRGRNLEYVRAAKALGVSDITVMSRHILPNAMVATLTYLPFILSGSVTLLSTLDFLGFGLPPGSPSLGELVAQAKNNLQAPWLAITAFVVLGGVLTLLIFVGEAVRDAFDPQAPAAMSLVEVENLSVAFGSKRVVDGVSFTVDRGETLALVGESGSGKSLTALSLLQLLPRGGANPAGRIRLDGNEMIGARPSVLHKARGELAGIVFQEPMTSLNPLQRIGRQVAEAITLHRIVPTRRVRAEVVSALTQAGFADAEHRLDAFPHQLSGGQRQRVMIAMALANNPALLIADEPTTALDVTIQAQILALLAQLKQDRGLALLLITHDLQIVRRYADRLCVMKGGVIVEAGPVAAIFAAPAHDYTRMLLSAVPKGAPASLPADTAALLQADDVRVHFPVRRGVLRRTVAVVRAVDGVSVNIRAGETVGLVGESGSGKTTLGLAALRMEHATGRIRFDGQDLASLDRRALRRLRARMQIVFQDPFGSLSPRMSIGEIVAEGLLVHEPRLTAAERGVRVAAALEEVGLAADMADRYPHEFSGGQRQRVAIARAMILQPRFVVLDEPTSALDMSVQAQIVELLRGLQQRHGLAYLFISHDLKVVRALAHRVVVLRQGKVVEQGEADTIFAHPTQDYTRALMAAAFSLEARAIEAEGAPDKSAAPPVEHVRVDLDPDGRNVGGG